MKTLLPFLIFFGVLACAPTEGPADIVDPNIQISLGPSVAIPSASGTPRPGSEASTDATPSPEVIPGSELIPLKEITPPPQKVDNGAEGVPFKLSADDKSELTYQWTADKGFLIQKSPTEVSWVNLNTSGQTVTGKVQVSVLITNAQNEQRKINFFLEAQPNGSVDFKAQTEGNDAP